MTLGWAISIGLIAVGIALVIIGWRWRNKEKYILSRIPERFKTITELVVVAAYYLGLWGIGLALLGTVILWSLFN